MSFWKSQVFLIAEAGVNHNGDPDTALRLIDAAAEAGCDAVKFQTFNAAELVTASAPTASYQQHNGSGTDQLAMLRKLELPRECHQTLQRHAADKGVLFFSTAFDMASIDFLKTLDIPLWKIPSGEITNYPYLVRIAGMKKPILLSTGMSSLQEVQDAVAVLLAHGASRETLCVLHCNTQYPTPLADVNLRAMVEMGKSLGTTHGYSDHTPGHHIAVAATALGARVIEKHLTLDRSAPGPDHKASLQPEELKALVGAVREIERALGDGIKRPSPSEMENRPVARKSLVAARPIAAGEVFSAQNMTAKRPGTGVSPMRWNDVLGQPARRAYATDELIDP